MTLGTGSDSIADGAVFDVIVVGSGAGGMLAANRAHDLGLSVLLVEKSDRFGGTSAVSGGAIWVPCNDDLGGLDDRAKALAYLRACTMGRVPDEKLAAYVDNAMPMVRYSKGQVGLGFKAVMEYPDYYPDREGALPGGRTMDPDAVDGGDLGDDYWRLREPYALMRLFGRISLTVKEARAITTKKPGWPLVLMKLIGAYATDFRWRLKTKRDRRLSMGNALAGGLLRGLVRRGVPRVINARLLRLTRDGERVTGAVISRDGKDMTIAARRGVILAAGGFERNAEMRKDHLPQPTSDTWSVTPYPNNTGDAIRAGRELGAALDFMDLAWWAPSMRLPSRDTPNTETRVGMFMERGWPGSLIVNPAGRRFANEAMSYNDFGYAMIAEHQKTGAGLSCWMVFDATFRKNYVVGGIMPGMMQPDRSLPPEWFDSVIYRAGSIAELAGKIGVPAPALAESVARMNGFARTGKDTDFGRGDNVYDRYFGDRFVKPNPCLGPIEKAPFYAVRVDLGDIGTKGGLKTDARARVLDEAGEPIAGLYAIGNCSASVMAAAYPGAGATLGPAMTFGFIAVNDIAGARSNQDQDLPPRQAARA
ncbi:FAD-dependent oxidoreductase [Zavarzinia aquatilis]|uniref:3-oxosteroid 1-dehydrogenase n=1 Tax=Zavarzinia aquatilis TaxID=2211142 RepID=A0A317DZW0_9PROT|nr:FAD-dependent oxidoreductase [Zavarzinia aquatilis]PWR19390.1 3-oxosteroid 1-dehydrogenase [Zavarzinia aquatilis]